MLSALMWVAMFASGAAAGWAVCDARRRWRARQLSPNPRWRLRDALDLLRVSVAFLFALDLLVVALVSDRTDSDLRPVVLVTAGAAGGFYALLLLVKVALRRRRTAKQ